MTMEMERACYSVSALNETADRVKAIDWHVNRKNEHFAKCTEIEKVFAFAADNLNRFLFDPEIELKDYRRMSYDFKSYKKTDLDQELNRLHRFIGNELNAILAMIRSGEVDYKE